MWSKHNYIVQIYVSAIQTELSPSTYLLQCTWVKSIVWFTDPCGKPLLTAAHTHTHTHTHTNTHTNTHTHSVNATILASPILSTALRCGTGICNTRNMTLQRPVRIVIPHPRNIQVGGALGGWGIRWVEH